MKVGNKGTGAGGARTNQTGIDFEQTIYLPKWIQALGLTLKPLGKGTSRSQLFEIYEGKKFVGYYGRQAKIYTALKMLYKKKITNEHIKRVLSKKIFPDAFIISIAKNTLTIFEKKWQQGPGSVDEKLQTAPYKLAMFEKLLRGTSLLIQYHYILSSWFNKPEYENVKSYYKNNEQVWLWVDKETLTEFDLSKCL